MRVDCADRYFDLREDGGPAAPADAVRGRHERRGAHARSTARRCGSSCPPSTATVAQADHEADLRGRGLPGHRGRRVAGYYSPTGDIEAGVDHPFDFPGEARKIKGGEIGTWTEAFSASGRPKRSRSAAPTCSRRRGGRVAVGAMRCCSPADGRAVPAAALFAGEPGASPTARHRRHLRRRRALGGHVRARGLGEHPAPRVATSCRRGSSFPRRATTA